MSAISTILTRLRAAIWAIDVRDDIANAIEQCYSDVSNPTLRTEALEAALQNKIDQGKMAALTIGDGTITGAKLANGTIPKSKLDPSITFDADAALDPTSTNAIQNKVVASELKGIKADLGDLRDVTYDLVSFTWKESTAYPLGWRTGYWQNTAEGVEIASSSSNRFIRTSPAISVENYPDMENAYMFSITPPNGYSVRVTEYDITTRLTIKQYGDAQSTDNPQLAGKAIFIPFNKSNGYVVTLGRFEDVSSDYITAEFISQIILTAYLPRTSKKDRTGDFEFFTVNAERPLSFGGEDVITETQEIECVLRLPTTYKKHGTPTRLVMACHGASGYIQASTQTWYNASWKAFMDALLDAGYAVFDANVLPTSEGTDVMGFSVGSPLYVNVLKKAYDYIQDNYNVYKEIFAHGTSMGGVGATAFSYAYPNLVLAESSFAGRNFITYLYRIYTESSAITDDYAVAYGYTNLTALANDKYSHCEGYFPDLSLVKYENGVPVLPPDRETNYSAWLAYYSQIGNLAQTDDAGVWAGNRKIPYKAWNSWADNVGCTKLQEVLKKAYNKGGACPYYVINYDSGTHTQMGYGQINDMIPQLIAWYKRWE